jgi:hypothetical protein
MNKIVGVVSALGIANALIFAQSTPSLADVTINNVLSPFTTIQVGPGYGVNGTPTWWLHNPHHNARCQYRWHPYYGEWRMSCVRMRYGREEYYRD